MWMCRKLWAIEQGKDVTYHYDYLQLSFLLSGSAFIQTLTHILTDGSSGLCEVKIR